MRSTPIVIPELIPRQGGCCLLCRIYFSFRVHIQAYIWLEAHKNSHTILGALMSAHASLGAQTKAHNSYIQV